MSSDTPPLTGAIGTSIAKERPIDADTQIGRAREADAPVAQATTPRNPVDKALKALDLLLQVAAVILLGMVTFSVSWQVIARYVTSVSTPWTVELASISFVWLAMFAIALGVRRGRHMVLDIWEYIRGGRWLTVLIDTVAALIVAGVLLALVWFGFEALGPAFRRTMPGLGISYGFLALAVPVGSIFALIFAIEAWWRVQRAKPDEDPLAFPVIFQPADTVIIKGEI
ncbi:TRAP transporter small permease [Microterricola viridarii]|uniref:TRAP transporter small permease n=1 Tax=Microterricola viridarii TaxID=412690 RepID=UPI00155F7548|nr:TRAP transporter small permease [Microterricola viridarii]